MNTLYFKHRTDLRDMSAIAIQTEVDRSTSTKRGKKTKEITNVTPVTEKLNVQKTVFDLKEFDNVKLVKSVDAPQKPQSLKEASEMLNNDTDKLLNIIYAGLVEDAREKAKDSMDGFKVYDEDKDEKDFEPYAGSFADEEKGKLINAAVLSLAKMQGYEKGKSPDEKRALKEKAREFLRSNPAMLASIQK